MLPVNFATVAAIRRALPVVIALDKAGVQFLRQTRAAGSGGQA
jgi:hypothetical protein